MIFNILKKIVVPCAWNVCIEIFKFNYIALYSIAYYIAILTQDAYYNAYTYHAVHQYMYILTPIKI